MSTATLKQAGAFSFYWSDENIFFAAMWLAAAGVRPKRSLLFGWNSVPQGASTRARRGRSAHTQCPALCRLMASRSPWRLRRAATRRAQAGLPSARSGWPHTFICVPGKNRCVCRRLRIASRSSATPGCRVKGGQIQACNDPKSLALPTRLGTGSQAQARSDRARRRLSLSRECLSCDGARL